MRYLPWISLLFVLSCSSTQVTLDRATTPNEFAGRVAPIDSTKRSVCLQRRKNRIKSLGDKYAQFIASLESRRAPEDLLVIFSGCLTRESSSEDQDQAWLASFYHEGHHFLSSAGYGVTLQDNSDGPSSALSPLPNFFYYSAEAPRHERRVNFYSGTPALFTVYPKLKPLSFLRLRDHYFAKPPAPSKNSSDFYALLDEWNAYVEELDLRMHLQSVGGCSSTEWPNDSGNSAMEFAYYCQVYLETLREADPKLFAELSADETLRAFISHLVRKTQGAIRTATQNFPCLFSKNDTPALRELYATAGKRLKAMGFD